MSNLRVALAKILYCLHRLEDGVLLLIISLLVLLPLWQIFTRMLSLPGLLWIDQATRLLVLWLAMCGAMLASRQGGHIRMDLLDRFSSPVVGLFLRRFGSAVAALVCGVVSYYTGLLTYTDYADGGAAFLSVPLWSTEVIIPLAFTVMAMRFLAQIISSPAADGSIPTADSVK